MDSELMMRLAAHEAGHAVVGVVVGLDLIEVVIDNPTEIRPGEWAAGGTRFVERPQELDALGRTRPRDVGLMCLAGALAEQVLTARMTSGGSKEDIEIMRRGFGWTKALTAEQQEQATVLHHDSRALVKAHLDEIALVRTHLLVYGHASGDEVRALIR